MPIFIHYSLSMHKQYEWPINYCCLYVQLICDCMFVQRSNESKKKEKKILSEKMKWTKSQLNVFPAYSITEFEQKCYCVREKAKKKTNTFVDKSLEHFSFCWRTNIDDASRLNCVFVYMFHSFINCVWYTLPQWPVWPSLIWCGSSILWFYFKSENKLKFVGNSSNWMYEFLFDAYMLFPLTMP